MADQTHIVTRDGNTLTPLMSENDCWSWILRHQPMSVDWAMRYEGYAITPIDSIPKTGPDRGLKHLPGTEHYQETNS